MNFKMLKSKKVIATSVSIILVLALILGILVYFNCVNKTVETSTQPINMEEKIGEEADGKYIDINELEENNEIEESQENVIDETVENNNNDTKRTQNKTTSTNKNTNTAPYYIKVNYGAQVVTIYKKDEKGDYAVPVKAMVCSTGVATPKSGVYSIPARWRWLGLQGGVCGQYCTQIKGNILFHSVPYLRKGDPASLEYWEYDKLGTYASAGCIRLTVSDAMWIYNNCANGTKVEFYSSTNPGPLGKPSAKKISSYPDNLRNWDPTDPDSNNPWKTYRESEKTDTNNKTNTVVQNTITNNSNSAGQNTTTNNSNSVVQNTTTNNSNNVVQNTTINNNNNATQNTTTNNNSNVVKNETTNKESQTDNSARNNINTKNVINAVK